MRIAIFSIALVLGLGAAGVSYHKQKNLFTQEQESLAAIIDERESETKKKNEKVEVIAGLNEEINTQSSELSQLLVNLDIAEQDLASAERKSKALDSELEKVNAELDNVNKQIAAQNEKLRSLNLSPGVTPEQLTPQLVELDRDITENRRELQELEAKIDRANNQIALAEKNMKTYQADRGAILKKMSLNTWTGRVVSVDSEWGLVVFSGGSELGLEMDKEYLVTRGSNFVAKLTVVSMEGNQTLATIDPKTRDTNTTVRSGDRVILAEPVAFR